MRVSMIPDIATGFISCSQNDTKLRKWEFQLIKGDDVYTPSGNISLVCSNQVEVPMTISGDTLYCDCTSELSQNSGSYDCKIKVETNDEVLYSARIILKVEARP